MSSIPEFVVSVVDRDTSDTSDRHSGGRLSIATRNAADGSVELVGTLQPNVTAKDVMLHILLAYAKLTLKPALIAGTVLDDPAMNEYLLGYFPAGAVEPHFVTAAG